MTPRALLVTTSVIVAMLDWTRSGRCDVPAAAAWTPRTSDAPPVSPDARRFLAPSAFSYWAGAERVFDGELSLATPRPVDGIGFLPARDDHLSTTAYLSESASYVADKTSWNVVELSSLHDLRGGAALGMNFRVDARTQTALSGIATAVLPLPQGFWLVPTLGAGAESNAAPQLIFGAEARSDRAQWIGYTIGVEGSRWTYERTRVFGKLAVLWRLGKTVAIEERFALGAWDGGEVRGDLAMRWISAALQTVGDRTALYERATLTRDLAMAPADVAPNRSAFSTDIAIGFRRTLVSSYGFAMQIDEGAQEATFRRWGAELTIYGGLF